MANKLKIQGDTSGITKSITDLGRQLKKVGKDTNPVSIFDKNERTFIKEELGKAIEQMNKQFSVGKNIISDLIKEQKSLKKGSESELKIRRKIVDAMKDQSKLSQEISSTKGAFGGGGEGGGGKGFFGGIGGILKKLALGAGARATYLGFKANSQFVDSSADRVRAQGLGMSPDSLNEGTSEELASSGMTRREFIQSRIQATSLGSREAGSGQATLQRGQFERTFGLEQGQMTDVMSMLRPSLGGDEANDAQMKLQESIFSAGIEDAIGPYLESITGLLSEINETGMTSTSQLINAFAGLSADGARTPEQLAATFGGLDSSVKGSSGERNALLQQAFANSGIGGGTIGGTQFAIESGGIMGMDRGEFEDRGFSPDMLDTMGGMGLFGGEGEGGGLETRGGSLLDMLRSFGGMEEGDSFGDMTDPGQITSMANFSNNMFGTQGAQGLDTAMILEKVESGQMTREAGTQAIKDIKQGKTPDSGRLDIINDSLAGVTQILRKTHESNLDILGRQLVHLSNIAVGVENLAIMAGVETIDSMTSGGGGDGGGRNQNTGGVAIGDVGESFYSSIVDPEASFDPTALRSGKRNRNNQTSQTDDLAASVEKGTYRAGERLARRKRSDTQKNSVNVNIQNVTSDGNVQNSTIAK